MEVGQVFEPGGGGGGGGGRTQGDMLRINELVDGAYWE